MSKKPDWSQMLHIYETGLLLYGIRLPLKRNIEGQFIFNALLSVISMENSVNVLYCSLKLQI